jgi:DNA-binding NarL/FixJ family response regulator
MTTAIESTGLGAHGGTRPVRVLLVDDSPAVRDELRALLQLVTEVEVAGEAADGERALEIAPALQPDAVLLDLQMPVMDGPTAARRLRTLLPGCRLVAFTVHAGDNERRLAQQAGFDAFVVKGSPLAELIEALTHRNSGCPKERS